MDAWSGAQRFDVQRPLGSHEAYPGDVQLCADETAAGRAVDRGRYRNADRRARSAEIPARLESAPTWRQDPDNETVRAPRRQNADRRDLAATNLLLVIIECRTKSS